MTRTATGAVESKNTGRNPETPESDWVSLTVLCFKPEVLYRALEENQAGESFEFGRDIIPLLLSQNCRVYGYKFCGYWGYTRTVEEYWQSNMDLLGDTPLIDMEQWGVRTNLEHRRIRDFQPALMGNDAVVENSLVYNGCVVEGTVRNSILFPGVKIEKGAVVENSVLFFDNDVGSNCRLNKVVADVNSTYEEGSVIGSEMEDVPARVTVVGWNNRVPRQTIIEEGATIYPHLKIGNWLRHIKAGEVLR